MFLDRTPLLQQNFFTNANFKEIKPGIHLFLSRLQADLQQNLLQFLSRCDMLMEGKVYRAW